MKWIGKRWEDQFNFILPFGGGGLADLYTILFFHGVVRGEIPAPAIHREKED